MLGQAPAPGCECDVRCDGQGWDRPLAPLCPRRLPPPPLRPHQGPNRRHRRPAETGDVWERRGSPGRRDWRRDNEGHHGQR